MTTSMTASQLEYLVAMKRDFSLFSRAIWHDRKLEKVAPLSEIELDMLDWIAHGPSRRGILAPRGVGKTHFTMALCAWTLFRNPERKIIVVFKEEGAAKKTVSALRTWIDAVPFLKHLAPLPGYRDATYAFDVGAAEKARQPSMFAVGIGGSLENNRAHLIIADDIETDTNTDTLESRLKLAERCGEFESILYPDQPDDRRGEFDDPSALVYVGTYHHEESVYLKEAENGVVFRTYPIVYPSPGEDYLNLAPIIAERVRDGTAKPESPVYPHRFDVENIAKKRARRRHFDMQHKLLINLGDKSKYPLRLSDIIVMSVDRDMAPARLIYAERDSLGDTSIEDIPSVGHGRDRFRRPAFIDPTYVRYVGTKAWIDPSGRGDDLTGVVATGYCNGRIYVKGAEGITGGFEDDALNRIAAFLRLHNVREAFVEHNWGGGGFAKLLEVVLKRHFIPQGQNPAFPDGWACSLSDDTKITHTLGQKEKRIIGILEPAFSQHRVVFDRAVACNHRLQHQITRLTTDRDCLDHDDLVDALAGSVAVWDYALAGDPTKMYKKSYEDQADRDREAYIKALDPTSTVFLDQIDRPSRGAWATKW
jgi:hypothetical protein